MAVVVLVEREHSITVFFNMPHILLSRDNREPAAKRLPRTAPEHLDLLQRHWKHSPPPHPRHHISILEKGEATSDAHQSLYNVDILWHILIAIVSATKP